MRTRRAHLPPVGWQDVQGGQEQYQKWLAPQLLGDVTPQPIRQLHRFATCFRH
jgi:hypothetical protein